MNFDLSTQKFQKFELLWAAFDQNVWAKKSIEELCLMALKIDAKLEGKMTCAF